MKEQKVKRTYKEFDFQPATLGGLAVHLKTEKGWFFVFSITTDLSEIVYDYSETGHDNDFTKSYEIDIDYGDGFYEKTKPHIIEALKEFQLDKRASELFDAWYKVIKS